jgi:ATP-binding cassette subfamily B protein
MSTAQMLWRLIRYRFWIFLLFILGPLCFFMGRLVFGVILQAFFNLLGDLTLHHERHFSGMLWLLLSLLILAALLRWLLTYVSTLGTVGLRFEVGALLWRNLLQRVLDRPGARAIPGSAGSAISYFRDDVQYVTAMLGVVGRTISLAIFTISAIVVLLRVNALVTLLVFTPLTCVVIIAQTMKKHLEKFRKASRLATARLTGLLGEIFSSVQAIQVAGAESHVIAFFEGLN